MRLKTLAMTIILVAGTTSVYAAPEAGIDIRGPGGVMRPTADNTSINAPRTRVQTRVSAPRPRNVSQTNTQLEPNQTAVVSRTTTTSVASNQTSKDSANKNISTTSKVVIECFEPQYPAEVKVDEPKITRFSLTAVEDRVVTVSAGASLLEIANLARPDSGDAVDDWQIIAALVRENRDQLTARGFKVGSNLRVPTVERMWLESGVTGQIIEQQASNHGLLNYKLPPLELPWQKEDERINDQKARQAASLKERQRLEAQYNNCLAQKKKAEEEAALLAGSKETTNVVSTAPAAKEVLSSTAKTKLIGEISSVVDEKLSQSQKDNVAQLKQIQEDLRKSQAENAELKASLAQIKEQNKESNDLVASLITELKNQNNKPHASQGQGESSTKDANHADAENQNLLLVLAGGLGLLVLILGFYAVMRLKRNKMKLALHDDDEDDLSFSGSLPGEELEPVFGAVTLETGDKSANKGKNTPDFNFTSSGEESKGKGATDLDLGDMDKKSDNNGFPDLENPDESIPEKAVRLDLNETESPDLVPSRHNNVGPDLDLDETKFKQSIEKNATSKSETNAPSTDDRQVMDEWAAALAESNASKGDDANKQRIDPDKVLGKNEAKSQDQEKANESADKASTVEATNEPQSDAAVMDEWAAALAESQAPKAEEPKTGTKDESTPTPESDETVMDEWAAALAESQAPKAEEPKTGTKDESTQAPQSDAAVMDEWAAALAESQAPKAEEPKTGTKDESTPAPQSDAAVMDEWAAALAESQTPKTKEKAANEKTAAFPKSNTPVANE